MRSVSAYAPPAQFAAQRPQFQGQTAAIKFGIHEEDGPSPYDQVKGLHEAGIAFAKAGDRAAAKRALLKAFEAGEKLDVFGQGLQLDIVKAIAEGVPGLKANPKLAAQLLDRIVEPRKGKAMRQTENGWQEQDYYRDLSDGVVDVAALLADYDDKYRQLAVTLLKDSSGNVYGSMKIAQRLVALRANDEARGRLLYMYNSYSADRARFSASDKDYARVNIDRECLSLARLIGGLEVVTGTIVGNGQHERISIPEIADGEKARQMLLEIAERTESATIKKEILNILATGEGAVPQDKEAAKRIIDSL